MQDQFEIYTNILAEQSVSLGLEIPRTKLAQMIRYMYGILEENRKINLTSIDEPVEFIEKHLIDSLIALPLIEGKDIKIIDVGTGGGFPGVPLAIALPSDHFILLDSTAKKLMAIERVLKKLNINNIICVHARAEEASRFPAYRDQYNYAVSRAVAPLPVLCELCLPFVKKDGFFLAFKSKQYKEELNSSKEIITDLGGEVVKVVEHNLPVSGDSRSIIVIKKITDTPKKYPRSYAKIRKALKEFE